MTRSRQARELTRALLSCLQEEDGFAPPPSPTLGFENSIRAGAVESAEVVLQTQIGEAPHMLCLTRRDEPTASEDVLSATLDSPLMCELQFGLQRASERVRCDWLNGMTIAIPTGDVLVRCISPAVAGASSLRQTVGCMISEAHPVSGGVLPQARLTERPRTILNLGTSAIYVVPARAHAVRLYTTLPSLAGSFRLDFLSALNAGKSPTYATQPDASEQTPLGAGVRALTVYNGSGFTASVTLQWSIAL